MIDRCCGYELASNYCPHCGKARPKQTLVKLYDHCVCSGSKLRSQLDTAKEYQRPKKTIERLEAGIEKWNAYARALRIVLDQQEHKMLLDPTRPFRMTCGCAMGVGGEKAPCHQHDIVDIDRFMSLANGNRDNDAKLGKMSYAPFTIVQDGNLVTLPERNDNA